MLSSKDDIEAAASRLVRLHGGRAPQKVVDAIVTAVRNHDLALAKRWEEVGVIVDRLVAA